MMAKLTEMREKLISKKKDNKGFTLVELIVVIVILAILVGVTIGGVYGYVNKSRINTDINNASAIASALAPITTNKNITVTEGVTDGKKEVVLAESALYDTATKKNKAITSIVLGLKLKDGVTPDPATEMFPQGIDAPKAGGAYKITYTVDATTKAVTSVSVIATSDADGTTQLTAQE